MGAGKQAPRGPELSAGVRGAACGPQSSNVGMRDREGVVVRWTIWWVYWGTRGDTGDGVMGVVEGAWRRWELCTGDTGVRMAVLGSVWWEYLGRAAVLGSSMVSMVGVLGGLLAVLGCPPDPLNN